MSAWIQSSLVQTNLVQGDVAGVWQVHYPSESSPEISWFPSAEPLPGSRPGRLGGVLQQHGTSGRKRMWVVHEELYRWRLVFDWMTAADVVAREAFYSATRNKAFRVQPILTAGYFTACWTGASLNFDPESRGAGYFRWEEHLEEQPEGGVSSSAEMFRDGVVDVGVNVEEVDVIFSTPFDDDNYVVTLTILRGSTVDVNSADVLDDANKTDAGFKIILGAISGPTPFQIYYLAKKRL